VIICPLCKRKRQYKVHNEGKSRVVETRDKTCRSVFRGKVMRSRTVTRVRECTKCRYRWKTVEVPYKPSANRSANAARR
jgi:hypothetical protein